MDNRVVIGMTGATGQIFGIKALQLLNRLECEVHLVLSDAAKTTIRQEDTHVIEDILSQATQVHEYKNIGASIASGSFQTNGMLIAPCSMKSLSNIAHGNTSELITRAADVTLKERRPLVLMPREKPFNRIHLKNMLEVTDAGGVIVPPFPSYYQSNSTMEDMVERTAARAISYLEDIESPIDEWEGLGDEQPNPEVS